MNKGYNIETGVQSCDDCVFFSAAGCDVDRLEKLKLYDMKRFCNLYRDVEWFKQWQGIGQELDHRAIEESEIAIDFIIYDDPRDPLNEPVG